MRASPSAIIKGMGMLQKITRVPNHSQLFWPVVEAFRELGGSADKEQLLDKIADIMGLSDDVLAVPHKDGPTTELGYRVGWVQSWLKAGGMMDNPSRGVWVLNSAGRAATREQIERVLNDRRYINSAKAKASKREIGEVEVEVLQENEGETSWQTDLLNTLKAMPADAFERLTRLLLLQLGFSHVEVVGRSGDGGIDCIGLVKVNSVLSFKVLVQCKRYKATVGPGDIRDFRGAMQGRTDKALFVTTGRFTGEAKKESSRDGVPAIDLIDGEAFATLLKDIQLGVKTEMVEKVSVVKEFFADI